ncbi:adhesion G-protein coupled receptor D1-like [Aplysia californica]|uniref:Adhesion G-protein coupled receptor D1-like n=1 Tax=Aplysia californica TaxID=6500 RepID=A0ABM1VX07_APLCA|nr:adhesion G-protein coupled receptor D1-like [Aplysia californica]
MELGDTLRKAQSQEDTGDVAVNLVSPVLSLRAYDGHHKLNIIHTFTLRTTQVKDKDLHSALCGFQTTSGRNVTWDTFGCTLVQSTKNKEITESLNSTSCNKTVDCCLAHSTWKEPRHTRENAVTCRCNHTTNFALLMRVVDFEVSAAHELALSVVTYVGCSVTLITQLMAVTVFTCIRSLNSERVCVHRNLCLAIIGMQLTFISGIKAVENKLLCSMVAVVLHYFSLASFVWMLVEGLHLYSQVVRVFGTEKSRILYYIFFGWGVPGILVSVSAAVDWHGYGTRRSCWLSISRATIWAFVGPAAAVIAVNVLILGIVLRIVVSSARADRQQEFDHVRYGTANTSHGVVSAIACWRPSYMDAGPSSGRRSHDPSYRP